MAAAAEVFPEVVAAAAARWVRGAAPGPDRANGR